MIDARASAQEQALTPAPDAAKAAKDLADAQTATANAQKATADAQLAAFKAMIGEVPASGYNGTVDLKDKTVSTEAAFLAAKAVNTAAKNIVDSIAAAMRCAHAPPASLTGEASHYSGARTAGNRADFADDRAQRWAQGRNAAIEH